MPHGHETQTRHSDLHLAYLISNRRCVCDRHSWRGSAEDAVTATALFNYKHDLTPALHRSGFASGQLTWSSVCEGAPCGERARGSCWRPSRAMARRGPPGRAPRRPGPEGPRGFRFAHALTARARGGRAPAAPPLAVPLPAPRAHVRFRIRHGDKDKFFKAEERTVGDFCFCFIRTRAGHADIRATAQLPSGEQLEADTVVAVTITDVNDSARCSTPRRPPAHGSVARVAAEDADLGLNGEIYYSLEEPTDRFAVHPTSGVVSTTRPLSAAEPRHELTVLARDRQSLLARRGRAGRARAPRGARGARQPARARHARAAPARARRPRRPRALRHRGRDRPRPGRARPHRLRRDRGRRPDGHFRVRPSAAGVPGEWDVLAHPLREAGAPRGYNLTLRARAMRAGRRAPRTWRCPWRRPPPRAPHPVQRELYEAAVSESAPPDTPVIRLKVAARDEPRDARVYFEIVGGNEGGEFRVNPDTGVLYTARELDAEQRAARADRGLRGAAGRARDTSPPPSTGAVLDANDNDPVFEQSELDVAVPENGPAAALLARGGARCRLRENAYISCKIDIGRLEGKENWSTWRCKVLLLLRGTPGGLDAINGNLKPPTHPDAAANPAAMVSYQQALQDYNEKDSAAMLILMANMSDVTLQKVMRLTSAKQIWDELHTLFDGTSENKSYNLCYSFFSYRKDPLHDIDLIICKILETLPDDSYFPFKSSWMLMSKKDRNIENLTAQICSYERSLANKEEEPDAQALVVQNLSHKTKIKCGYCKLLGHKVKNCRKWISDEKPPKETKPSTSTSQANNKNLNLTLMQVETNEAVTTFEDPDNWYVDNGATSHVTGQSDVFSSFEHFTKNQMLPSGEQLEADTVVAVTITDVNDLSPLFYPTEYDVLVAEDAPHGSVARVAAEDADLGLNGEIYYSLEEPTDRFAVHPPAASAAEPRHELTVLARDRQSLLARGEDAPAARARLVVRVAPANLHAPDMRARRLPERGDPAGPELYAIVAATDRDQDRGRRPDGHFRVRPSAAGVPGEWDVLAHPLREAGAPRGYNLTLRARDAGRPPRAAYLALPVAPPAAPRAAPVFSRELYEAAVSESAPPDTPVIRLKVAARDEPRDARVYFEIVGGNEGGEFRVNPDTGVLYTARELDAEQRALHALTVACVGPGGAGARHQSSAKVQQSELDVAVPENGPAGAVLARVAARDADSGENAYISYSLANLRPVPFDVDHFSGAVRAARVLDYESMRREHVLRVRASDWGLPYRRQAELRLRVRLLDFERVDCVGYLPRRLPAGAEIVTLSAIDFDAGDVVSYRIVGGNDDNCFALDASTGVLGSPATSRVLNVTATDGTHFADPTSLVLHLTGAGPAAALECRDTGAARRLAELLAAAERSNAPLDADEFPSAPSRYGENLHAPEFVDFPVEVKVNESVALGTTLVRLAARDRDLGYNGLLSFAISGGDPDSAFRVDPDTGELQVIGYLDREREAEYFLNVTVWDGGRPRRAAARLLPVTVLDVNDNAPRFQKALASFRVTENALNGTAIFRANATDRDAGEFARVTYGLAGGADGEFCVERDTGVLLVCAPLDRERLTADALVRVAVDDVNDCAPRFPLAAYSARVPEDVPRGTLVAVVDAFDPDLDAGGRVTYSLPDQAPDDVVFTVDELSGVLRTAKRLDFEERQVGVDRRVLVPFVIDSGLTVSVFVPSQVYGVTVRATDGGQPALWAEATLIVEVLDVDENQHAPAFAERVLAAGVREDAAPGAQVLAAAAEDADPPGRDSRLAYYIVGGSGMAHFSIDDTGMRSSRECDDAIRLNPLILWVIRTLSPLDRETTPHYWLTVCAQDHGLVPRHTCVEVRSGVRGGGGTGVTRARCVQVYIEVEDVNDMAPWPERAAYAAAVLEHCAGGTRVAVVRAEDADASPTPSNITYSIVAGNPDGLFSIDEHTGEIVTTGRTLDREATPRHALEVSCSDGELSSTARVLVQLLDINDHAPAFPQRFYELNVPAAPAPAPAPPASLQADQPDSAEWDSDDEDDGSGARPAWDEWAGDEPAGIYIATVVGIVEQEMRTIAALAPLTFNLLKTYFMCSHKTKTPALSTFFDNTLVALDDDLGANGSLRYSWRARGPARPVLRLHAASARLYAARALRSRDTFDITVRACDGGAPARCGVARVSVRGRRGAGRGGRGGAAADRARAAAGGELDAPADDPTATPSTTTSSVSPRGFAPRARPMSRHGAKAKAVSFADGDEFGEFSIGRSDGSLVLARRLLYERRARYALTVSASDGTNAATAVVSARLAARPQPAAARPQPAAQPARRPTRTCRADVGWQERSDRQ
ncbi:hypothetical protein MSG28_001313 [Choristoneura fumiferana]|uniref:Uncharacterized protein n=1 Tax=Choristoneura fumiferana TaxID=7141 RepID=A0ACC0KU00_CHOFU|nr:hypothetical protein MSG28_001313 [Choristoneura fumiferana]